MTGKLVYFVAAIIVLLEIEIAIEIGIDIFLSIPHYRFLQAITPSPQAAEHCGHSVELGFPLLALLVIERLANDKDILDRGALQCRPARNFKVPPSIGFRRLSVAFGDVQRYRLAGTKPLIAGMSMIGIETCVSTTKTSRPPSIT